MGSVFPDWSGTWESQWRGGGAVLFLEQEGDTVTGSYPLLDGELEGTVSGRVLEGVWWEASGRQGGFVFAKSEDGSSFSGRFDSGEWWTGNRISHTLKPDALEKNFSSPREVMRTFLVAAGSHMEGDIAPLALAVASLSQNEETEFEPTPSDLIRIARYLYMTLDLLTFRVWDLPGDEIPETRSPVSFHLSQQGTDESFEITFVHTPEGWRILAQPLEELKEVREQLLQARRDRGLVSPEHKPLSSPRETLRTFLTKYIHDDDASRARLIETMDLSHLGTEPRAQEALLLAEYLKRVIDRVGFVIFQEIPDDPWQQHPYVHFSHPLGTIALSATEFTETGAPIWQFNRETMESIRQLFLAVEDLPTAGFVVPPAVRPWTYFWMRQELRARAPALLWNAGPLEIWQWLAILLSILVCWFAAWVTSRLFLLFASKVKSLSALLENKAACNVFIRPLRLAWTGFFFYAVLGNLGLPERLSVLLSRLSLSTGIIAMVWMIIKILHLASDMNSKNLESPEHNHRGVLLSLTLGVIRVTLMLAGIVWLADIWAVPYSSMLTGLGIGGIAVALATQSTLQNVIAGFTLFADRPLSVGDFCRYGNNLGSVERIGLRSVRIRTLERSVVSIPTAAFAEMQLENLAVRDRFLLRATLNLRYETTADQLRFLLAEIRKMLVGHPKILPDPARVRFDRFGDFSLDVEIFAYVSAVDWNEYLAVREDVHLRLMHLVEKAGSGFAFPSQTTYLARDDGLDEKQAEEARRQVDRWRKTNKLPSPDYSHEDLENFEDQLDFPPEGSVLRPPPED